MMIVTELKPDGRPAVSDGGPAVAAVAESVPPAGPGPISKMGTPPGRPPSAGATDSSVHDSENAVEQLKLVPWQLNSKNGSKNGIIAPSVQFRTLLVLLLVIILVEAAGGSDDISPTFRK
jgi:hypothetical protein